MALNRKQKQKLKTAIIVVVCLVVAWYAVTKTALKTAVNSAALKMGIGTAAAPLIK